MIGMVDIEKVEFIEKFQKGTKDFSLQAIQIFRKLPKNEEAQIIDKQFFVQRSPWEPTIGQRVARGQKPNFLLNWV